MGNNEYIPENDQLLAQNVGDALEEDRSLHSVDDDLIPQIINWRKKRYEPFNHEIAESKRQSWENISGSITQSGINRPYSGSKPGREKNIDRKSALLKIAAVFFLVALISVFYLFQSNSSSKILIQSGAELTTHTFEDGSHVKLRPHSTLYVINKSETEPRYRLEGEAFFNVSNQPDRRFLVNAGPGIIEVIGTTFNVREWGDQTTVFLQEGSLRFSTSNGSDEVILKPGELASVDRQLSISEPVQSDGNEYLSWQENEIVFNNRTAESVFRELEHHFSITILAPDNVKKEILGGTLSLENRSKALENLGIVLGGNFSSIEDNTFQFVE